MPRTRSLSPSDDHLEALKLSPEVGWYLTDRGVGLPQPWQVPRWKTPEPRELEGAAFDPARVDRVLDAFGRLVHTQGRWAGRPLRPDVWQVAYYLAPVFGWVHLDEDAGRWVRIIRTAELDLARKNGKTTVAGGTAIYLTCADGESGAQVIAVAASKDQARYCFSPVKLLAEKSPALSPYVRPLADKVVHKASGSYFAAVASVGDLIHGSNLHGAVVDELHVHKSRDVVDAVETGVGARDQPLVLIITTPDDGRPGTIYAEKRRYLEQCARGVIVDPTFYGCVWGYDSERELAELGLDPFSEEAQRRANPGYGVSPTRAFLTSEAKKAKETPTAMARYLRLHLGIRTKQVTRYIRLEDWDANSAAVDEDAMAVSGLPCHGGLDLGSVHDITALCWTWADRGRDLYRSVWRLWLPEDALDDLDRRTAGAAAAWARQGWLTLTPGAVFDPAYVSTQLDADAARFAPVSIGYDPWRANDVTRHATDSGMTMVQVRQSYAAMSPALTQILRLVLVGRYHHGGNPAVRWMLDNLAVATDPAGNVKPDKAAAADRIDAIAAAVNAMADCMGAAAVEVPPPPATARQAAPVDERELFRPTGRLAI